MLLFYKKKQKKNAFSKEQYQFLNDYYQKLGKTCDLSSLKLKKTELLEMY